MNRLSFLLFLFLPFYQLNSATHEKSDYTVFNVGIQPALFSTNAGLSINVLNLFYGAGIYINRYGMGTFAKKTEIDNIDVLVNSDSAWRSTTLGITFKLMKNLYVFVGHCDGEFQIVNKYFDNLSSEEYEIKQYKYFPGNEFGFQYELKNFKGKFSLNAVLGLNYSLKSSKSPIDFWPENPVLIAGLAFGVLRDK